MQFDYVIVGAGSAGCVLANRLSADPSVRVALVEAGGRDWYPWIHIPVGYFKTMNNPAYDWCLETEPDPGLNGRSIRWPRGKVLGGSSSINGLLYVRGQPRDYDVWAQMGNPGWSWSDVEPYFRRAEGSVDVDDGVLGREGPLAVSEPRLQSTVCEAWIEAAEPNEVRKEESTMADRKPFDKAELKAKVKEIVRAIHNDEDPSDLNAYKRFVKRHVSIFTRGYFTAYLLKYSGVRVATSQDQSRRQRSGGRSGGAKPSPTQAPDPNKKSVFVSIGRNRRVHSRDLITLFTSTDGVSEGDLGPIKVLDNYSFVEIETSKAQQAIDALDGTDFRGRKLTVNFARKR